MSAPPRSLIVVGTACPQALAPRLFTAYGDADDPLRLTVLVAEYLSALLPELDQEARMCQSRKASWSERREALRVLLARASQAGSGYFIGLSDVDALKPERHGTWEDTYSFRTRSEFFSTLLEAIDRGGWVVLRPSLSRSTSPDLAELDTQVVEPEEEGAGQAGARRAFAFAPECWPVVSWLLRERILQERDLAEIVDTVEDFDEHVLAIAYDSLPASARDAAKVLSTVRAPLHLNGTLGAFQLSQELSARSVPRRSLESLRRCGFLQPAAEGGSDRLRMPRFIRSMLLRQGRLSMWDVLQQTHEWLALQPDARASTDERLELHFHAVRSGNIERAVSTASFYGTELRELATELSRRRRFSEAARLFELLVEQFDSHDPYAWEYLGYNLARAHGPQEQERILRAYERACQLAPNNPLYQGRLLGFRGELGQDISREFARGLERYVREFGDQREAVAYFAKAALEGLKRGGQHTQLQRLLTQWHALLGRFAPRLLKATGLEPTVEGALDA